MNINFSKKLEYFQTGIFNVLNDKKDDSNLIIFTHEWNLTIENKRKLKKICEFLKENNYVYDIENMI